LSDRPAVIAAFLAGAGFAGARSLPLAQDASFRRYLRLVGGPRPAVLMDAPPPEDVRPFLRVAAHLSGLGLSVPTILAADPAAGLVLEEDLGDALLSARLDQGADPQALFDAAVDALVVMQRAAPPADLPAWDPAAMTAATLNPLLDWWWPEVFGAAPPAEARADLTAALAETLAPLAAGPRGFTHRDYFAGNLIALPDRPAPGQIGILDFQSAAIGHPAYDLISLVEDARRDLPDELRPRATARLLAARPDLDAEEFARAAAICAAQRHLRVATQWVRLARRDHRPAYLAHGPRSWRLLARALAHPAAAPLAAALDRWIPPALRANPAPRRIAPTRAMVLAAGLGTRMRPLTETTAKPLLRLAGRSLLDHALDRLDAAGVTEVAVNAHWCADQVAAALAARAAPPATRLFAEPALLDTAGGVRAARAFLGADPFYVINGDAFWLDGPTPTLARLAATFAAGGADAVLLLVRAAQVAGETGRGDFALDAWGVPRRRAHGEIVPYLFAGVQLIAPALLDDLPDGPIGMNHAWDRALAAGRLRAVVHDGLWFHLSTPADLAATEAFLRGRRATDLYGSGG
jgi:aminoglycoside/choline kinase family phosphotransferase/CTP:molybdopterin cytidylyltransferase MocA